MTNYKIIYSHELYHHGILGQKWGVRRFQNPDGSLTLEGRKRYGYKELKESGKHYARVSKNIKERKISENLRHLTKVKDNFVNKASKEERQKEKTKHEKNLLNLKNEKLDNINYKDILAGNLPTFALGGIYYAVGEVTDNPFLISQSLMLIGSSVAKTSLDIGSKAIREATKGDPQKAEKIERYIKIGKTVVTGALVASAVLATADIMKSVNVQVKVRQHWYRGHNFAMRLSEIPISELSDVTENLPKGSVVQRIIRHPDKQTALAAEDAKPHLYVTTNKNDNSVYKALLNARGVGKKYVTTRLLTEDIKMPSPKERITTYIDLVKNNSNFRENLIKLGVHFPNGLSNDSIQASYQLFSKQLGSDDASSVRETYFDVLRSKGYTGISDDNDAGYLGTSPVILLDPKGTTVLNGIKQYNRMANVFNTLSIKDPGLTPEESDKILKK